MALRDQSVMRAGQRAAARRRGRPSCATSGGRAPRQQTAEQAARRERCLGELDAEQIFYLRSRGIPDSEARAMLVAARAHAVASAAKFTGDDAFLLLVGDHLYLSHTGQGCAEQLVAIARAENCAVSAVQATHESKLPYYGAVGGKLMDAARHLYQVDTVLEKPTPTEAEQQITVPGLRAGYYLCFFGMHVLTPTVQRFLAELLQNSAGREQTLHLRAALAQVAEHERYLAVELAGRRYDFGLKFGLLTAQLALALEGCDRDEVLRGIVELLATGRPSAK
jgi:UTP--glucose-1-phosphate uridylyltransferase